MGQIQSGINQIIQQVLHGSISNTVANMHKNNASSKLADRANQKIEQQNKFNELKQQISDERGEILG